MKKIIRKISLDLSRKSSVRLTFATETDMNSREFLISLYDSGVFYRVEKTCTAAINVRRPDGQSASFLADITEDGLISYTASLWVFAVVGEVELSVSLYCGGDTKITSNRFTVDVAPSLYLGEDIDTSSEEYSLLGELISEISEIKEVENERANAETGRALNELSRENNESAREFAESQRNEAEKYRDISEEYREEAENDRMESEIERSEAEKGREAAEQARASAESAREAAEAQRGEFIGDLDSTLDELLALQEDILDGRVEEIVPVAYPVGAIYLSVNDTAPASIFGGTWERLKDRFLLGAGDTFGAGSMGGSDGVMLVKDNLPGETMVTLKNTHWADITAFGAVQENQTVTAQYGSIAKELSEQDELSPNYSAFAQQEVATMPPYLAVYMWKRIA